MSGKEKVLGFRKKDAEALLNEWIAYGRKALQIGSGDDCFYEMQFEDYINKQRKLWIGFILFIERKRKLVPVVSLEWLEKYLRIASSTNITAKQVFINNLLYAAKKEGERK